MNKKEELRKVPTKNYIILIVMFIITFALVYYLYRWYDVYSDYQKETPVIRDVLPEINGEELDHYVQENPTTVVYMCTSSSNNCRTFENKFKKLIEKESLEEYITYINLSDVNTDDFTNNFNITYKYKKLLKNNYPALIVFEENNVVDIIQGNSKERLTITDVEKFLKENEIGE